MKNFYLVGLITLFASTSLFATTYQTIASGNWSSSSVWQNGLVPSYTPADTIIIKHSVNFGNNNVVIYDYFEVTNNGTLLTDRNKSLRIHQFAVMANYGIVQIPNLIVDGTLHNYQIFEPETFTNNAIGTIHNHTDARFESSGQVQNKGIIINDGLVTSPHIFVNNDGTLTGDGGSYIFDHNFINNAGATITCSGSNGIDLCSSAGVEPSSLVSSSGFIDSSCVTICGEPLFSISLPITLVSFEATPGEDGAVVLNWTTQIEINNEYFELERSLDGENFETVQVIKGAGNSNVITKYSTIDNPATSQTVYYRLRQTDYDGTSTYSQLVSVQTTAVKLDFDVSPNPSNGIFSVRMTNSGAEQITINIYNTIGQKVYFEQVSAEPGLPLKHTINVASELPLGNYYLTIDAGNEQIMKQLIVQ